MSKQIIPRIRVMVTLCEDKAQNNAKNKYGQTLESIEFSRNIVKLELKSIQYMESVIYCLYCW